jgi:hypothetical protein
VLQISTYEPEIERIAGTENMAADAVNHDLIAPALEDGDEFASAMQEAHKETSGALPSGEEESDAQKKATVVITREAQLKDEKIAHILRVSTDPKGDEKTTTHAKEQMAEEYARMAGKLCVIDRVPYHAQLPTTNMATEPITMTPYVPEQLRQQVIASLHDDPCETAHLGEVKTLARLRQHCYWPMMSKLVGEYVSQCHACSHDDVYRLRTPEGKLLRNCNINIDRTYPYFGEDDVPTDKLSTEKLVSKPSVAAKSGQTQPPPVSHAGAGEESVEDDDESPRIMPSAGPPPGLMAAELNPPDVSVPDELPLVEEASAPTAAAPDMATAEDEQNIPVGSEQNIQDEPEQIIPEEPELTVPVEPEQSVLADSESANSGPPRITQSELPEVPVQNLRRSTRARRPPQRPYDEELSRIYRSAYAS